MDNDQLTALLGRTDAVFLPIRDWRKNGVVVAQMESQKRYRTHGLPVPRIETGADATARKSRERWLNAMEQQGVVVVSRSSGRRTFWRLPDATDWRLRRLVGGYGYWSTITAMRCIRAHVRLGAVLQDSLATDAVAEFQLVGCQPREKPYPEMGRRCGLLEEMLLPGLLRDWATAASDVRGTTCYAVTSAGEAILADPLAHAPAASDVQYSPEAERQFWLGYDDQVMEFRQSPTRRGLVAIAIGCGDWDWYADKRLRPFTLFTPNGKQRSVNAVDRAYAKLLRDPVGKPVRGIGDGLE